MYVFILMIILAGIMMLLAVPLFDQSNKWCLDLPNVANISFHFPTVLRIYMLAFIPGNRPLFHIFVILLANVNSCSDSVVFPICILVTG